MSQNNDIESIRRTHDFDEKMMEAGDPWGFDFIRCHAQRGRLLQRVEELEARFAVQAAFKEAYARNKLTLDPGRGTEHNWRK